METARAIRLPLLLSLFLLATSCGITAMDMNVVVFNYWPRAMADVYLDGQHVGAGFGAFGPGGTGGSISCCHKVKTGEVQVKWMLGGGVGDSLTGTTMSSSAQLSEIKPGAKYLGIYLYPDGTVALETARGIPDDRLRDDKR